MICIFIITIIIISFAIVYRFKNKNRRYKKVKPLSKMTKKEFKKTMEDLEIK